MACVRCGSENHIERHHIKQRIDGGGNEPENMEDRCRPCHKYEHAKRNIEKYLNWERGPEGQTDRLKVLEKRLSILEEHNTVELIRERGTYQPYFDYFNDPLPRRKPKREVIRELQLAMFEEAQS